MRKLVPYLGAAVILTIIFGTIYAVIQHAQRNDADYPQIQIAEDLAAGLNKGADPMLLATGNVDLATDLDPFTVIYNTSGEPIAGSGRLDGRLPMPPIGVLTAATGKTYSRVTWQPRENVRVAAVVVAARQYYVLSGRSLAQVEHNETASLELAVFGWIAALAVLCSMFAIQAFWPRLMPRKPTKS